MKLLSFEISSSNSDSGIAARVEDNILRSNLMMVDSAIADIIIRAMQGKQNGTLLPHGIRDEFFESKIKRLLESLVFGMKPNETWNGDLSAFPLIDTGYGFDIYKKGAFIDCLYENTILKMSVLHKSDTESVLSIEIELQN